MKRIIIALLVLVLFGTIACAEGTVGANASITIADVIIPTGVVEGEVNIVIALNTIPVDSKEQVILDEIAEFVQEKPVVEFFGAEVMASVVEYLPETVELSNLVVDELLVLNVEGYDAEFGDVEAVFEFATHYEEDTVLVVMVGILPAEGAENDEIIWVPLKATVQEGKVSVAFTQDVLEAVQAEGNRVVLSLLRAEEVA